MNALFAEVLQVLRSHITQITHASDVKKPARGTKHSIVSPFQHECSMYRWKGCEHFLDIRFIGEVHQGVRNHPAHKDSFLELFEHFVNAPITHEISFECGHVNSINSQAANFWFHGSGSSRMTESAPRCAALRA